MSYDVSLSLPNRSNKRGSSKPVIGDEYQLLVDTMHGKHYADTLAGRVFSQMATPLGLAIPIYTATAIVGGMPVWNPVGSNVNVELIKINTARASGTADFASVVLMGLKVNQSNLATAAPITAFAETTPKNGLLGSGVASAVKSSNAGTCTITAGTATDVLRNLFSINLEADTGTAHATTLAEWDADGTLVVPPGWLVWVAATKASVALYATGVVWKEVPLAA